jgi:hypothetical protein
MHAGVFATSLKENVVTVLGPSCCERSMDNGPPMALPPKFRMRDDIFEEPLLAPGTQQVWGGDQHASCNDLGVHWPSERPRATIMVLGNLEVHSSFGRSQINQMLVTLITAGLIYKDRHGKYLFAVPLMADFIKRTIEDRLIASA